MLHAAYNFSAPLMPPIYKHCHVIPTKLRERVLKDKGKCCTYCGKSGKMQLDHVVPRSQGGPNTFDNLIPVCPQCNTKRKTKGIAEFLKWREAELSAQLAHIRVYKAKLEAEELQALVDSWDTPT